MRRKQNTRRGKQGFTLMEMLVTIAVMLLVTEMISLTIQLSTKYYTRSVRTSESQTICGALSSAIQEELQYATRIQPQAGSTPDGEGFYNGGFTYYSRARQHGSGCTLTTKEDGKVYIRKGTDKYYALIGSESYTYGMKAELSCRWNADKYFHVELKILDGSDVLSSENFNVYPLNLGN